MEILLCMYKYIILIFTCSKWITNPLSTVEISENKFSVYPNPSSNFIKLKSLENNDEYMISIFDIFGKEIIHNLKNPKQIDISSFVKGQYIMKIETKDGIINERLLKI